MRTVTLMGVAPTYLKMPLYHAQAAARAMELLLKECESDAPCHEAFPQIRHDWQNVLAQLGREPARVQYSPPDKSAPVTVEIQRDVFAEKVRTMLYAEDKARRIPFMVHRAATGDFAPFLQEAIKPSIPDFIADGMYLSVTCAEDVPFIDQAEAAKLNAGRQSVWELPRLPANPRLRALAAGPHSARFSGAGFVHCSGADFLRQPRSDHTAGARRGSGEVSAEQPARHHPAWGSRLGRADAAGLCRPAHHGISAQRRREISRYKLRGDDGAAAVCDEVSTAGADTATVA